MDMDPEYVRLKVSGEIVATIILGLVLLGVIMCLLRETWFRHVRPISGDCPNKSHEKGILLRQ